MSASIVGWREELKTYGYYECDERNDTCWYLIFDFVDEVMNSYRSLLVSVRIPHNVCMKILSDMAYLAIKNNEVSVIQEYGRHLVNYLEHPETPYENKFDFDYKSYTDDVIEKVRRANEERERIKNEEAKRKRMIKEQIRKMEASKKEEDERKQIEFKRIDNILHSFIREVKKNKPFNPRIFAIERGFDLEEVLKIVRLSELIGLTTGVE